MPRFAANLTMLFNEVDFLDRFAAAASAGFKAVEYMFPEGYDKEQLAEKLAESGLTQALHNLPAGDWPAGDRGIACQPDRVGEFQDSVGRGIAYAKALACPRVNCLAGIPPEGANPDTVREIFVNNLKFAAQELENAGVVLTIEAINTRDVPGFYLNTSAQALAIIDEVGSANLTFQYDVYHMQIMEGDLAPTLARTMDRIGHIQIADTPGRHEPGSGEINYGFLLGHIDACGYDGWIGCEYKPRGTTAAGLAWLTPYL